MSNYHASSPTSAGSSSGPLQVTGQRMHGGSRAGSASASASTQGVSPTGVASPPPFFAAGAPPSPMMQHQGLAPMMAQAPPSPGGYSSYPLSHPSSPVSRFNSQAPQSLSNVNLLAPAASCAIPSGLTSPDRERGGNSQQQRMIQQMIRPQASRSGGTGLAGAAFQHPLHSTAVQASHSLGQQKTNVSAAGAANGSSRVGSAGNNSGSASPAAGAKAARIPKNDYNTFPRLGSAAAAGSGSASRSAGSPSNDHLMSSGASPVPLQGSSNGLRGDRASPTMIGRSPEPSSTILQATGQSLHPRASTATGHRESVGFGVKRGVNVTRTPPQSQKKRSNGYRRNSEQAQAPSQGLSAISDPTNPDGELQHRLEDMDLGDDGYTPTEAASGYSSDASTFSEASAFPSAALVDHTNYTAPYYTQVAADDEEELADVSGGGTGTGHLGSRFPPPSSPMQLRPGGMAPPPHRMMGLPATPTPSANAAMSAPPSRGPPTIHIGGSTGPPTPQRSYSRHIGDPRDAAYPSSAESSAMQSPLMDGLLHSGSVLPPHPSSSTAASRLGAAAPFTFPMSPIPPIESGSGNGTVFDTSAVVAQQAQASLKTLLSASLTPLPPPTATLSGGLGLTLPSPSPLRLTTVPALNLPSPHALVDASALATSTSSSAASPRSATAGGALSFDPAHKYQLALQGLQGGDCSSAFSSARSLAHSTSGASLGAGSGEDQMTDFNSTARSLSGNTSSSFYSHNASNASSSTSLHQHQHEPHVMDQHARISYSTHMQR